jgi:hypothetical protein
MFVVRIAREKGENPGEGAGVAVSILKYLK